MKATRKTKKNGIKTVEGLKVSLDHMRQYGLALVSDKGSLDTKIAKYRNEWSKIFHRKLDYSAAKAYLSFIAKIPGQHGGMAPITYEMKPGVDGVYGSFWKYQMNGLEHPINSQMELCGVVNTNPPGANSNQFGSISQNHIGGRKTRRKQRGGMAPLSSLLQRPLESGVPTSIMYDGMMAWKGNSTSVSPDAYQPAFKFMEPNSMQLVGSNISQIVRTPANV